MAIYEGDQQTTTGGVINGTHVAMTPALVKASAAGGATAYQFTKSFTTHNPVLYGTPLSFRRGLAYHLDPTLRAFLLSIGAPMVAL